MGSMPRLRDGKAIQTGIIGQTVTDFEQRVIGNLNVCHSDGWHIGGDEINYYCNKINGAGDSLAN